MTWRCSVTGTSCFAAPAVAAVLVDSLKTNPRAHRFHERLGFEYLAQRDLKGDRCAVYRLPNLRPIDTPKA